ncbi:hypothetical protein GCM10027258_05420 [Amycolatopsis stemonae]
MNEDLPYGTRPDLLPAFVKTSMASVLDYVASRELEDVSLNRFPALESGSLDWDAAAYDERKWFDDEADWVALATKLLARFASAEEPVAIFWGTLVMPTVLAPADVVVRNARAILEAGPHFWLYATVAEVLIECLQDGQVTVASTAAERLDDGRIES